MRLYVLGWLGAQLGYASLGLSNTYHKAFQVDLSILVNLFHKCRHVHAPIALASDVKLPCVELWVLLKELFQTEVVCFCCRRVVPSAVLSFTVSDSLCACARVRGYVRMCARVYMCV